MHPDCCTDPDCTKTYREHLLGFGVAAAAIPTRTSDETLQTLVREKRWERDMKAYKNLRQQGYQPRGVDGAALREREGKNRYDIEERPVTIDWSDAS